MTNEELIKAMKAAFDKCGSAQWELAYGSGCISVKEELSLMEGMVMSAELNDEHDQRLTQRDLANSEFKLLLKEMKKRLKKAEKKYPPVEINMTQGMGDMQKAPPSRVESVL